MAKCDGWSRWILDREPDKVSLMTGDVEAQHKWIRIPDQGTELVVQNNPERFDGPRWRAVLSVFPDRLAAGRWARIIIWYALMRSLNPTGHEHEFENNWDDAHYAFLASYTHRIATHDNGMKRLIAAVFPSVTVCSWKP